MSQSGVQRAVGEAKLRVTGGAFYGNGGSALALSTAYCTLTGGKDGKDDVFGVSVEPLGARPDLDREVVSRAAGGEASYTYPRAFAVGYAQSYPTGFGGAIARTELLYGSWNITVGENRSAAGRDRVKDVAAIARQVIAFLRLPAGHATPYPAPREPVTP